MSNPTSNSSSPSPTQDYASEFPNKIKGLANFMFYPVSKFFSSSWDAIKYPLRKLGAKVSVSQSPITSFIVALSSGTMLTAPLSITLEYWSNDINRFINDITDSDASLTTTNIEIGIIFPVVFGYLGILGAYKLGNAYASYKSNGLLQSEDFLLNEQKKQFLLRCYRNKYSDNNANEFITDEQSRQLRNAYELMLIEDYELLVAWMNGRQKLEKTRDESNNIITSLGEDLLPEPFSLIENKNLSNESRKPSPRIIKAFNHFMLGEFDEFTKLKVEIEKAISDNLNTLTEEMKFLRLAQEKDKQERLECIQSLRRKQLISHKTMLMGQLIPTIPMSKEQAMQLGITDEKDNKIAAREYLSEVLREKKDINSVIQCLEEMQKQYVQSFRIEEESKSPIIQVKAPASAPDQVLIDIIQKEDRLPRRFSSSSVT